MNKISFSYLAFSNVSLRCGWSIPVLFNLRKFGTKGNKGIRSSPIHRWEDEEVSFRDMQSLAVATKLKGFAKIRKSCELALEEEY